MSPIEKYEQKKKQLSAKIVAQRPIGFSLARTHSNLFRKIRNKEGLTIDKRDFNRVLKVDPVLLIAEIEGMAAYEEIVAETLKYACLPAVVPELKTITLGGAISGCGIESSSFRYGLVHESVQEVDFLLADGTVITCTPTNEHSALFFSIPNSYGTLGYVLKAKIALNPTKKYVHLQHHRFSDRFAFFKEIKHLCHENSQNNFTAFIEGVIFHPEECYITIGTLIDEVPYLSNYKYMKIYYRSIQNRVEDYLTVSDYIWRWDTDWFWCSNVFYLQNSLLRFLFGKFMLGSSVFTKLMHAASNHRFIQMGSQWIQGNRESIIQDVLIPAERAEEFFRFYIEEVGIFPTWICPYRSFSKEQQFDLCPLRLAKLYLDFGFWGSLPRKPGKNLNRKIERKVVELEGFKSLYSNSYYSEEEFWKIYNRKHYEQLKQKYDPNHVLANLYSKCTT